jgi:hypothetical protein
MLTKPTLKLTKPTVQVAVEERRYVPPTFSEIRQIFNLAQVLQLSFSLSLSPLSLSLARTRSLARALSFSRALSLLEEEE